MSGSSGLCRVRVRSALVSKRVNGRGRSNIGERHFHRVLDRMKQLNHDVGYVAEGEFPALVRAARSTSPCLAQGTPHLQRVKQERLVVHGKQRAEQRGKVQSVSKHSNISQHGALKRAHSIRKKSGAKNLSSPSDAPKTKLFFICPCHDVMPFRKNFKCSS